jgi:hypothetical protein
MCKTRTAFAAAKLQKKPLFVAVKPLFPNFEQPILKTKP